MKNVPSYRRLTVLLLWVCILLTACTSPKPHAPKYIFLFIGDGMGSAQVSLLGDYRGTVAHNFTGTQKDPTPENPPAASMPNFMGFHATGNVTTYDASKFITDSAAAGTAIACGVKTQHGMLGKTADGQSYSSIAELLHAQGYKVGIISSASLDHATPAAFYANVNDRREYFDISLQLLNSGFEFFGGGGFKAAAGNSEQWQLLQSAAKSKGYQIADTESEILSLDENSGKTIAIHPIHDEAESSFLYEIDRTDNSLRLCDFVQKGLDVLGDDQGFFMMCEGGLIDWAAHRNDAATLLREMEELEKAIAVALEFYESHPDDTLILVTGDHETGGLSIGSNLRSYDTYLSLLDKQDISCQVLTQQVDTWRENGTSFEAALTYISAHFGLCFDPDCTEGGQGLLCVTDYEIALLQNAYMESIVPPEQRNAQQDETYLLLYSSDAYYDPFALMVTRILDARAGIGWASSMHTGAVVPIYAHGVGAQQFGRLLDNTDIYRLLLELCGLTSE